MKLVTLENGQHGHLFTLLDVFKGIDHYLNNAELTELELHCYTRGKNKFNMVDLYNLQEDYLEKRYCIHEDTTNTTDTKAKQAAELAANIANNAVDETVIKVNDTITIVANASSGASSASNGEGGDGSSSASAAAASSTITIVINDDDDPTTPPPTTTTTTTQPPPGTFMCKNIQIDENDPKTYVYIDKTNDENNLQHEYVYSDFYDNLTHEDNIVEQHKKLVPYVNKSSHVSSYMTIQKSNKLESLSKEGQFAIPTDVELLRLTVETDGYENYHDYDENVKNDTNEIDKWNKNNLNLYNTPLTELDPEKNLKNGYYDIRWGGNGGFIHVADGLQQNNSGCLFLEFKVDDIPESIHSAIPESQTIHSGKDKTGSNNTYTYDDTTNSDPAKKNSAYGMWIGLSSNEKVHGLFDPYTIGLQFSKLKIKKNDSSEYTVEHKVSILVGDQAYSEITLEDFDYDENNEDVINEVSKQQDKSEDYLTTHGIRNFNIKDLYWRVGLCYNGYEEKHNNLHTLAKEHEFFPFFNWGHKIGDEIIWREWPLFNTSIKLKKDSGYYNSEIGSKAMYGINGVTYKNIVIGGSKLLTPPAEDDSYTKYMTNIPYFSADLDSVTDIHPAAHKSKNKHLLIVGSIVNSGKFCEVRLKKNQLLKMKDGKSDIFSIFGNDPQELDFVYNKLLTNISEISLQCMNNVYITNKLKTNIKGKKVILLTDSPPLSKHTFGKSIFYNIFNSIYNKKDNDLILGIIFKIIFKEDKIININDLLLSINYKLINRFVYNLIKLSTRKVNNKIYVKKHITIYEDLQLFLDNIIKHKHSYSELVEKYSIYKEYVELDSIQSFIKKINTIKIKEKQYTKLLKCLFIEYNNQEILQQNKSNYKALYTPMLNTMEFKISNACYSQDNLQR